MLYFHDTASETRVLADTVLAKMGPVPTVCWPVCCMLERHLGQASFCKPTARPTAGVVTAAAIEGAGVTAGVGAAEGLVGGSVAATGGGVTAGVAAAVGAAVGAAEGTAEGASVAAAHLASTDSTSRRATAAPLILTTC